MDSTPPTHSHVHVSEGVHLYMRVHTHVCRCYSLIFRSVLELLSISRFETGSLPKPELTRLAGLVAN